MTLWRPITQPIDRKVLVTNNLSARDAHGQMSHVWITACVTREQDGSFVGMNSNSWEMARNLSHYAELPA